MNENLYKVLVFANEVGSVPYFHLRPYNDLFDRNDILVRIDIPGYYHYGKYYNILDHDKWSELV